MGHPRIATSIAVAVLIAGCVAARPEALPATPIATDAGASATTPGAASPAATPDPSAIDPETAHAIELRRSMGLRHDLAFVLAAAKDPATSLEFLSIPTYPDEDAKLLADRADQDLAVGAIQAYAADHVDEFGGLYIDRDQHPGVVTALWTDHLDAHRAVLGERLDGRFVLLRQVKYSYDELDKLKDGLFDDDAFFAGIPARPYSYGVDIIQNAIELEVSSAEPTAVEQIEAHYGLGDKLRVTSDGTGAMLLPRGTVKGKVLGPDGSRVRNGELELQWTNLDPGDCGGGDIGYGVAADGTFELPCQVGRRTITVTGPKWIDDHWEELGRATVTVRAGKTVTVTIRLTKAP